MNVVYDKKVNGYLVELESAEATTFINTDDVAEARKIFIERMTWLFNMSICEKLSN